MALARSSAEDALTASPVFQHNCAKCHGKTAEGRHFGGPSLKSAKVVAEPAEALTTAISNGRGRMPAFAGKLAADDIATLVQQIKAGQSDLGPSKP
jgi:mono/diheme cytochrome c family protein